MGSRKNSASFNEFQQSKTLSTNLKNQKILKITSPTMKSHDPLN